MDHEDEHNDLLESIQTSHSYTETDFINKCTPDTCTIMSMNCQSLGSKFDDIQVLCLQETWIEDADFLDLSLFQIQDYNLITQNRYASAHGGLAYYIHKNWAYTIRTCENKSQYWEEMFITLTDHVGPKQNKFSIGNFYRPPHTQVSQLTSFIDYFSTTLAKFDASNETTYVCGDYNINLLLINENNHCSSFFECILSSGYLPSITLPNRLSDNSTLIDNIIYNKQTFNICWYSRKSNQ